MKIDIHYDNTTCFTLLEPVDVEGWTVPEGTVSDGASVPRFAWSWCNPLDARYIKIFTWHDWAYYRHIMTRLVVDRMMLYWLIRAGMRKSQAYTIYYAVRLFGAKHWMV